MEVWHMREYLASIYPGWEKKLNKMPDNQIIAIYMRIKSSKAVASVAKYIVPEWVLRDVPKHYLYECHRCFLWFESENPDIQECRYCGATREDMNVRPL